MLTVDIAIITYNRRELLKRVLQGLAKQTKQPNKILILDTSPEKVKKSDIPQSLLTKTNLFFKEKRLNLPEARNFLLKKSTADIIVYIDDDAIPKESFTEAILSGFELGPNIAGVTGPSIDCDIDLEPLNKIIRDNKPRAYILPWGEIRLETRRWIPTKPLLVTAMKGCNQSYLRKDLVKAGGFDEKLALPCFREESDVQLPLIKKGKKFIYHPDAYVWHIQNQPGGISDIEEKAGKSNYFYQAGKNHRHFSDKHFPKWLSRLSWLTISRNPPSLPIAILRTIFGKYNYLAWHRGLWEKTETTKKDEKESD